MSRLVNEKGEPIYDDALEDKLNNPITPEQWDLLTDADFDHTDRIWFHTKHDKDVVFVKERKGKWLDDCGGLKCSVCGHTIDDPYYVEVYCTKCGSFNGEEVE